MTPVRRIGLGSMVAVLLTSTAGVVSAAVTPGNTTCELSDSDADLVYEIASQADLLEFKADFSDCEDAHLLQTASFVVDDATATSFGDFITPFSGIYDGGNHTITFNDLPGTSGLFGYTYGATIRNLHLAASGTTELAMFYGWFASDARDSSFENVSSSGNITGDYAAGLVAVSIRNTTITNSYTTGNITGEYAAGLVAVSFDNTTITNSYTTGNITGDYAAGLVTVSFDNTTITNSYTTGNITGDYAAGLVASSFNNTTITNSYTTGNITGDYAAGLVEGSFDNTTITNSYTTGNITGNYAAGLIVLDATSDGLDLSTAFHDPDGQWSTADAIVYLQGVPSSIPGQGSVWGACTDDAPFFLVVFAEANVCSGSGESAGVSRRRPPIRTVTLDPAGGACGENSSPWTVTQRRSVTLPTDCTRDGHTLLGWTRNPANTTPEYLIHDVMPRSGTVTAVWGKLPAAPTNVIALRDFLCDTCGTALVIWQTTDTDTTTFTVSVDDTPTPCTPFKLDDWWLCDVSGLTPNQSHTFGVTAQNTNGTTTTTTTQ
jgi:hypothetical protein